MSTTRNRDAHYHLADALRADIEATSEEDLLAEAAEVPGERRALVAAFDKVIMPMTNEFERKAPDQEGAQVSRAVQAARAAPIFGDWIADIRDRLAASVNSLFLPLGPRWALASMVLLIAIAGGFVLHWSQTDGEQFARSQSNEPLNLTGRYVVRLSWHRNGDEALALFRLLQNRHPALLGQRQPIVRPNPLEGRPENERFYLAIGPFATIEEARDLCDQLKAAGAECTPEDASH
jgi:hypothetical protein